MGTYAERIVGQGEYNWQCVRCGQAYQEMIGAVSCCYEVKRPHRGSFLKSVTVNANVNAYKRGDAMKRKKDIVHIRVERGVKEILQEIKIPNETDVQLLRRISGIFRKRGVPREISQRMQALQEVVDIYVCPELHEALELLRVYLISLSREEDSETRIRNAERLTAILRALIEGNQTIFDVLEVEVGLMPNDGKRPKGVSG